MSINQSDDLPRIEIPSDNTVIQTTRILKAKWTVEAQQDMRWHFRSERFLRLLFTEALSREIESSSWVSRLSDQSEEFYRTNFGQEVRKAINWKTEGF